MKIQWTYKGSNISKLYLGKFCFSEKNTKFVSKKKIYGEIQPENNSFFFINFSKGQNLSSCEK